jgi:glycerol kinase
MACVIAVDAGTTGVRALAVDPSGDVVDLAYCRFTQRFPRPAWVEHDPLEIWNAVVDTLKAVTLRQQAAGNAIAAIGVTNQRETVVAWDRKSGLPLHRAIVWQDRRTAERCDQLRDEGYLPLVRERTGLILDAYFSATKMEWLLHQGGLTPNPDLVLGTVDSWVVWNLTGGVDGGVLATEPSNAARTLLLDIHALTWSEDLCALFGVPTTALPELRPSCGRFGVVGGDLGGNGSPLAGVPVSGVAGDQQAALFGQACFDPGMAKATYGTGTFVLLNVGDVCPSPVEGLLTTVAWDLGKYHGSCEVAYVLEGSVFSTGSTIQWLCDGLGMMVTPDETEPLALQAPDTDGVYIVPAFTGMGSPWWDPYARGTIIGLTRGTGKAQLARAAVEAMAYQVRDVVDAMRDSGAAIATLRVDGGASAMNLLLQLQADQIRVPVMRPTTTETTALGVATMAGLAEGVWGSLEDLAALWTADVEYQPKTSTVAADLAHAGWRRAVERSLGWAAVP